MDRKPHCCRLCLGKNLENASRIDNPKLKRQIDQVFQFSIDILDHLPKSVCQSCVNTIAEFHRYSEQVLLNQANLCEDMTIEQVKLEPMEWNDAECEKPACSSLLQDVKIKKEPLDDASTNGKVEDYGETAKTASLESADMSDYSQNINNDDDDSDGEHTNSSNGGEQTPRKGRMANSELTYRGQVRKRRSYYLKSQEEHETEDKQIQQFYKLECDLCGHSTETFAALITHFKQTHGKAAYVTCAYVKRCSKKLFKKKQLINHMASHANSNAFRCKYCEEFFETRECLLRHLALKHGKGDLPYKCDQCRESFHTEDQLRDHKTIHDSVNCPKCGLWQANKAALVEHTKKEHPEPLVPCDTCGQKFADHAALNRHQKEHKPRVQCEICSKWIANKNGMYRHLRQHREKEQNFTCEICSGVFTNSQSFRKHKINFHPSEAGNQKKERKERRTKAGTEKAF